ncbi:MAG: hypothetical protein AB7O96_14270 [Pseudobdellovibrionaceae bacterium]
MKLQKYLPKEFETVPESALAEIANKALAPRIQGRCQTHNEASVQNRAIERIPINSSQLAALAEHCEVVKHLLTAVATPEPRMQHHQRWLLAQTCRQAGLPDEEIMKLFSKQSNFNPAITMKAIRGVDLSYPPPNCRNIASKTGLCNGRCENLRAVGGGSPIAFLEQGKKEGVKCGQK